VIRARLAIACFIAVVMVVAGPAAQSWASTSIRFVHAVPGAGAAELRVSHSGAVGGSVGFGGVSPYVGVSPGSHEISLQSGAKTLATAKVDLSSGKRYTVVAMALGKKAQLRPYADGKAKGGKASIRMIHAAPELGSPDVRLGKQAIAEKVSYTQATPYLTVAPGTYTLEVMKPGDGGGKPIVEKSGVALTAGTATTAFLLGSRGEPTRVVVASDGASAPAGAPKTGLAPLDGGRPWAAILGIALLAGLLGGAVQLGASRRRFRAR
jgi:hypothetical protein